jgi:hypothetical protein
MDTPREAIVIDITRPPGKTDYCRPTPEENDVLAVGSVDSDLCDQQVQPLRRVAGQ